MTNSFGARSMLRAGDREYEILRVHRLEDDFALSRLPYSLKVP